MTKFKEGDRVKCIFECSNRKGEKVVKVGQEFTLTDQDFISRQKDEVALLDGWGFHKASCFELVSETEESRDTTKSDSQSAFSKQVGASHYKHLKIQPMEYALANKLDLAQGNVVKYVTRFRDKNGIEDLKKAIHCIELLIEYEEKNSEEKKTR